MNYGMRDVGLAVAAAAACVSGASAQDGRFYVGISANAGALGAAYEKTVIVREGAPVANPPAVGDTHVSPSSSFARGATIGSGLFAGYRRQFADDGRYFSAEAQVAGGGGAARGFLPGTGMQRGENWPEDWSFGKHWSAGLTGRVGAPVSGMGLYLLGGARVTQVAFGAESTGCEHPVCSATARIPTSSAARWRATARLPHGRSAWGWRSPWDGTWPFAGSCRTSGTRPTRAGPSSIRTRPGCRRYPCPRGSPATMWS